MDNRSWSWMDGIDPQEHKRKDIKNKDACISNRIEAVDYHGSASVGLLSFSEQD